MVTRVDRKPIVYNTTFLRVLKPAVVGNRKAVISAILDKSCGYKIPDVTAREVLDDYEDIEVAYKLFGVDDPSAINFSLIDDDEDDECIRIARTCLAKGKSVYQMYRSAALMDEISKIQSSILKGADKIYYGTEAVYQVFSRALCDGIFTNFAMPDYTKWVVDTSKKVLLAQSAYHLIHPTAFREMSEGCGLDMNYRVWAAWNMFKKLETISIRIGSRKNMLAHAYYSGVNRKGFEPSVNPADDFLMPLTGYAQVSERVEMHMVLGIKYINIAGTMCALSHDDCVTLSTMAQCYFRTALYFTPSNGYPAAAMTRATTLVRDIALHCCRLIDSKKNFANVIRSMHIMSQGEFNDIFERDGPTDLGWSTRSKNYISEANSLDTMGPIFHRRATDLAVDKIDKLNTCFIYHVFVGDEMLIDDLRGKVSNMTKKVLPADKAEWGRFINFVKAYTLARFMLVNKKKPRCGGDISELNESWANRCIGGLFTMPAHSNWGKVWIEGEFKYTEYADTWHLDAHDVAYVVKDSEGIVSGKFQTDRNMHSELLMAMVHGNVLDTITGSTPKSARDRICNKVPVTEVVLTTAPKAENAKPSWKKRVTFAADCEFRKMQSEFDRNCRRVMSFIRGPSLGVDLCILEKQFHDIGNATSSGEGGAICSHDISAWSESMDRDRKFEFEDVLIKMFDKPEMINISADWEKINAVVTKQGAKDIVKIDNGSFQGFDGSSSSLLHSFILLYCIDTARRSGVMSPDVKTNMATLIDDCIALMLNLHKTTEANDFWNHLKAMYLKLGFEIDDLKSIFSCIKAIYLSRRFLLGGEVPADYKVFVKAHVSYDDPLRCTMDVPADIFGAMRGAADANGEGLYIYFCACFSVLAELAHAHNFLTEIPPSAASIFALAPVSENGWGFPSVLSWATNDVTDKRSHFNAILESLAIHDVQPVYFTGGFEVYSKPVAKAIMAIKSQAWRLVSYSNIFTNPFDVLRDGPLKPDMLKRNAIQDMLRDVAAAEPWKSLLSWNTCDTTVKVRELLVQSGCLHAPTLSALVNCMPDNYRLSLLGKAMGSDSLLSLLPNAARLVLKRRVGKCASNYYMYSLSIYNSTNMEFKSGDFCAMNYYDRTVMEREEFYNANGVHMIDHTFPDPVATFTVSSVLTNAVISPNYSSLRIWDKTKHTAHRSSHFISDKGMYIPRRSHRVWEVTCEYGKGWDTVSQRVAMGLSILARAQSDGHDVDGLLIYFVKAWNELSNISPRDTHLISIHGSVKRLDANPGSSTHPIILSRNMLKGFNNNIKHAVDAIPIECERAHGTGSHLHDFLSHETAMLCVTAIMFQTFQYVKKLDSSLQYNIATRIGCVIPESLERMTTGKVANSISIEIMDGADNYGLLQACPSLAAEIAIPTMRASWVSMINALIDRDVMKVEELRMEAASIPLDDLLAQLAADEVYYSPSIVLAAEPAVRSSYRLSDINRLTVLPAGESKRAIGDTYTTSVKTTSSNVARALGELQPDHILAATAIRSVVWSRMRSVNMNELAKILYQDPDADLGIIGFCSSTDFWRGVIHEINSVKRGRNLNEMAMAAFRSLGVPHIHITFSNDVKAVTHSVASFFGAHLKYIPNIISDLVAGIAGRSSKDFDKPFSERMVTNNPAIQNAKIRKEHMIKLVNTNVDMYRKRIALLEAGTATHRGDVRTYDRHARVVELRCRMYVYLSVDIQDSGSAMIVEEKFAEIIRNASRRVYEKVGADIDELPPEPYDFESALNYMELVDHDLTSMGKHGDSGWDAPSGSIGARIAYETICKDSDMVMNTKFAVAASEIAPRLHRRVIVTPASVPDITPIESQIPAFTSPFDGDDDDDDWIDPFTSSLEVIQKAFTSSSRVNELPIPYWHALYTLVYKGNYDTEVVNKKLGTKFPMMLSVQSMRDAHLEDFSDSEIKAAYPNIAADYVALGVCFDKDWLDRDDADAYTTDEMGRGRTGFLF